MRSRWEKGRLLGHVVMDEDAEATHFLSDLVVPGPSGEEPAQALGGDLLGDALGIDPGAHLVDGRLGEVGGEELKDRLKVMGIFDAVTGGEIVYQGQIYVP